MLSIIWNIQRLCKDYHGWRAEKLYQDHIWKVMISIIRNIQRICKNNHGWGAEKLYQDKIWKVMISIIRNIQRLCKDIQTIHRLDLKKQQFDLERLN